jgi:arsenate reductase-like glutaredoxin family protein
MAIVIYHNPACGTSSNTLAMIRQSGEQPEVIEYAMSLLVIQSASLCTSTTAARHSQ